MANLINCFSQALEEKYQMGHAQREGWHSLLFKFSLFKQDGFILPSWMAVFLQASIIHCAPNWA
jgi:hypothetical protein